MEEYVNEQSIDGNVKIADDVTAKIAIVVASYVDGVYYPSENLMSEVVDVAGKLDVETPARGVKVAVGKGEGIVDLSLPTEYGRNILDTCNEVQEKVKESVENMMGLSIVGVNVHVVEISILTGELLTKAWEWSLAKKRNGSLLCR